MIDCHRPATDWTGQSVAEPCRDSGVPAGGVDHQIGTELATVSSPYRPACPGGVQPSGVQPDDRTTADDLHSGELDNPATERCFQQRSTGGQHLEGSAGAVGPTLLAEPRHVRGVEGNGADSEQVISESGEQLLGGQ